jgi:hypothetical protein
MKPHDLDPLDEDLAALLAAERRRPPAPRDARARVLGRVIATVGPGGGGSPPTGHGPPPATPAAPGGLLLKPLLVGAALGSVVAAVIVTRPDPGAPPRPAAPASFEAPAPSPRPEGTAGPAAAAPPAAPPAPSAAPAPTGPAAHDESLAAERRLLDGAYAALAAGRSAAAFDALEDHARTFPRGKLGEEREALWIRALARAGRSEEARERAAQFRATHPHSLLLPSIEETVGTIP